MTFPEAAAPPDADADTNRDARAAAALEGDAPPLFAAVVFQTPLDRAYTYAVPGPLAGALQAGARVEAEFGRRVETGICVGLSSTCDLDPRRVKPLRRLVDDPPLLTTRLLDLGKWMAAYYAASLGEALFALLSGEAAPRGPARVVRYLRLALPRADIERAVADLELAVLTRAERRGERLHRSRPPEDGRPEPAEEKQAKVLRVLLNTEHDYTAPQVQRLTGYTGSPIQTLARRGLVSYEVRPVTAPADWRPAVPFAPPPTLTAEQSAAVEFLRAERRAKDFGVTLLQGVTGSGKTEVYLRLIEEVVAEGKSAIVLVPEIALTPQATRVFSERFEGVAVLHSMLTERERRGEKLRIRSGEARIVIGPRSALFAPTPRLGLIVVDEEQEPSFKQQNAPRYHARDVAVVRARGEGCHVVLGSASPSLETIHNVQIGKYARVRLTRRIGDLPMPAVTVVDMHRDAQERDPRDRLGAGTLSVELMRRLADTVARREQAILFLNRRGYHATLWCAACRQAVTCASCDVPLTWHKSLGRLLCHLCADSRPRASRCPACNRGTLTEFGLGTEKVEEVVAARLPGAVVRRMDSDAMRAREDYEDVLAAFRRGEIDVLVGTQMVAKGLDFPNVTLVGVICADLGLHLPDFRAGERTFQLVMQVAGRPGRAVKPGSVVVQTWMPDQPEIRLAAAHDVDGFVAREMALREETWYPPFCHLVRVEVLGKNLGAVRAAAEAAAATLRERLANEPRARVLGPSPCPIEFVRDRFRWQVLIKAGTAAALGRAVRLLRQRRAERERAVQVIVDVDPTQLA
ncbi:MAG: primosomal protein N' [Planctomycetes bacterium]|nr:primosomal protein N' [Planctomycetota bacterium]